MSFDFTALQDAIFDWVDQETAANVTVIWDKPNVPRPATPYVTMFISVPSMKIGQDSIKNISDSNFEIGGQRRATLSLISYADVEVAQQIMIDLQQSLEKPSVLSLLRSNGLAVWNEPEVSDISAVLETGFESRANMDVMFGLVSDVEEDLGAIESVEVEGTANGIATSQTIG